MDFLTLLSEFDYEGYTVIIINRIKLPENTANICALYVLNIDPWPSRQSEMHLYK